MLSHDILIAAPAGGESLYPHFLNEETKLRKGRWPPKDTQIVELRFKPQPSEPPSMPTF